MHLLDSSVWIALFIEDDSCHARAELIFVSLTGIVYVPYCIVLEVVTILERKHSLQQALKFLSFIENDARVLLVNDDIHEEVDFFVGLGESTSFVDASLLFLSKKLGAQLTTFDKNLLLLAKKNYSL